MNDFLTISKYSQKVLLTGKEFCEKENKILKYCLFLPVIITIFFMYIFFILYLNNFLYFFVGIISVYFYYATIRIWQNYKTQKHLQDNIEGYSFSMKTLWNTDWNNPILLKKWCRMANKKVLNERISSEKISFSLNYYKNIQSSESVFTIELILLVNTILILSSQKEFNENSIWKEIIIVITIFLFFIKILYKYYQKNKTMDNNSYKKIQFLCEYLLQKQNKDYLCNIKK
ncbi:hypothetical protein [Capnocytophaga catalasegens]|uniref:Uncharacterized protein n=1 Tax=Capnocytophaga catalasegens TaxID=1004260 RepID=A0AAV5AWJ5_9FLAO|nr:hypothetical protein [Capnocytophaga catalasegens]GIZ15186.1 hypothetical protein RCZ03_11860 [Capnocytophaga catalasegens]GJM49701.1 hypothetical protein RCZ15_06760 [Capnocytophaga catalasegens]GJM52766.1 hypothetical protein RCZ16_10830 [Capnocytophaga catalasegens]